jgi:carbon starvation protein CstA
MPDKPATRPSQARDGPTLIGSCDGVSFVPASEYNDYLKGFRQVSLWAAAILAPLVVAVILMYWGWQPT